MIGARGMSGGRRPVRSIEGREGRAIDGVVVHSAYAEALRRLPNARFEDATNIVGFARYVKGEEEIASLRRGAQIAAAGLA
jgi:Xaa-Pro aminopeptidase